MYTYKSTVEFECLIQNISIENGENKKYRLIRMSYLMNLYNLHN